MNYKQSIIGSAIAFILATSCCWLPWLIIGIGSATGLASLNEGLQKGSGLFMAAGIGLLGLGFFQFYKKRKLTMNDNKVILQSTISCPKCGHQKEETMPTDACQYFYECEKCKTILKPLAGDCCVYCSFGTVPCPLIQLDQECC